MLLLSSFYLLLLVLMTRSSDRDEKRYCNDKFVWGRTTDTCSISISDERNCQTAYSTLRNDSSGGKPVQTWLPKIDWDDCHEALDHDFPTQPLTIIEDTFLPPDCENRAILSLPPGLVVKESGIPGAGMGVWAEKFFPKGVRFGPYGGETYFYEKEKSKGEYTWVIKCRGKRVYYIDGKNERKSNWLRYINMARKEVDQNLKTYQYLGQIYYTTYKPVQPGTELLQLYGFAYGAILGINMDEYYSDSDIDEHGLATIPNIDWEKCHETKVHDYPTHPLTTIEDTPLPEKCHNRSKRSIPPGLGLVVKKSGIPGAGLGVWAETIIPAGLRFGPYRGKTQFFEEYDETSVEDSGYGWTIFCGDKDVYYRDGNNEETSNWLRYINMPRNYKEENIMYFQHHGHVYYWNPKPIYPGTELLVFYGYEYAKSLGIDMKKYYLKDKDDIQGK